MAKIDAYVNGFAFRRGERSGAFAALVTDGKQVLERSYKVHGATANQAEIRAAQFAMLATVLRKDVTEFRLHTSSHYLAAILEKDAQGKWLNDGKANSKLISELREVAAELPLRVLRDSQSDGIKKVCKAAKVAAVS